MKESPIRYFYDTEFVENGHTIDLVSFGMIAAPDWALDALTNRADLTPIADIRERAAAATAGGIRTYYAVNADVDLDALKGDDWLVRNVLPHLPLNYYRKDVEAYIEVPGKPGRLPDALKYVDLDRTATVVKPKQVIANEVRDFIRAPLDGTDNDPRLELWADYCAYDHVALAQLWGRMIDLPTGIPMYTNDLQQLAARLGSGWKPDQAPEDTHNALADAWHALEYFVGLDAVAAA